MRDPQQLSYGSSPLQVELFQDGALVPAHAPVSPSSKHDFGFDPFSAGRGEKPPGWGTDAWRDGTQEAGPSVWGQGSCGGEVDEEALGAMLRDDNMKHVHDPRHRVQLAEEERRRIAKVTGVCGALGWRTNREFRQGCKEDIEEIGAGIFVASEGCKKGV